jgi:hypothetical protein
LEVKLTDEDRAAIARIVDEAGRPETEYREIALHFLRAGMERAADIADAIDDDVHPHSVALRIREAAK